MRRQIRMGRSACLRSRRFLACWTWKSPSSLTVKTIFACIMASATIFGCSYCILVSNTIGMLRQDYIVSHTSVRRGRDGGIVARHMVARECLTRFRDGETLQWQTVKFQPLRLLGSWSVGFRVKYGGHTSSGDKTAGKHLPG